MRVCACARLCVYVHVCHDTSAQHSTAPHATGELLFVPRAPPFFPDGLTPCWYHRPHNSSVLRVAPRGGRRGREARRSRARPDGHVSRMQVRRRRREGPGGRPIDGPAIHRFAHARRSGRRANPPTLSLEGKDIPRALREGLKKRAVYLYWTTAAGPGLRELVSMGGKGDLIVRFAG